MKEVIIKLNLTDLDNAIIQRLDSMDASLKEVKAKTGIGPTPSIENTDPEISVDPAPKTPPIEIGVENFTQSWLDAFADDSLNELIIPTGKTLQINPIKISPLTRRLKILTDGSERSNIISGAENYRPHLGGQDPYLIHPQHGAIFSSHRINFCQPKQLKLSSPFTPSIFQSTPDINHEWALLVQDCDTTALGRHGGMGVGFLYGGKNENHIGMVNFKHAGGGLISAKNPFLGGQLVWTMDRVMADFPDRFEFGDSTVPVTGYVKDEKFYITSPDVNTDVFLDNENFTAGPLSATNNFTFILHIGRYTFEFEGKQSILDEKTIKLRHQPKGSTKVRVYNGLVFLLDFQEAHVGDSFHLSGKAFKIIEKDRTAYREWSMFSNEGKPMDIARSHALKVNQPIADGYYTVDFEPQTLLLSNQPAILLYKGNFNYRTTINTKFGEDYYINQTHVTGHQCYNHPNISIWARDSILNGYYRSSASGGKTSKPLMCNFINTPVFGNEFRSEYNDGTKDIQLPITQDPNIPMPERIRALLL